MKKSIHPLIPIISFAALITPPPAKSWPWGAKNFEECVASDMKGRPSSQTGIVKDSCRKSFPAIPEFLNTSKTGNLKCIIHEIPADIELNITKTTIQIGQLTFNIIARSKDVIHAKSEDVHFRKNWKAGTGLVLNFEWGTGLFKNTNTEKNEFDSIRFECHTSNK